MENAKTFEIIMICVYLGAIVIVLDSHALQTLISFVMSSTFDLTSEKLQIECTLP